MIYDSMNTLEELGKRGDLMAENNNIAVFKDTLIQSRVKYSYFDIKTHFYTGFDLNVGRAEGNEVIIRKGGTVSTGYEYAEKYKTAILNFADALEAGGLVWEGARTQEENICRCTNLYPVLASEECKKFYYDANRAHVEKTRAILGRYREVYTDRIIYTEGVTVFKDDVTYENIEPRKLDVITCPSPREHLEPQDALGIYMGRIIAILMSAVENGAECVILGAWGCGAFGQNPYIIAKAFSEALKLYGGNFKKVVFAIRPTHRDADLSDIFYYQFKANKWEVINE